MAAVSLYLTFRVELGDPISSLAIQPGFLEISLVSGKTARLPWNHPKFRLTFFDGSRDPHATPTEQEMVILRVDRLPPVYGGMNPRDFDTMVLAAKGHGLTSTTSEQSFGKGKSPTRVLVTVVEHLPSPGEPTAPQP